MLTTAVGPSTRERLRRTRGPIVVGVIVLVAAAVVAVLGAPAERGLLRTDAPDPQGSRALVTLLRGQGVAVDVVTTDDRVAAAARPGTTVLVAFPAQLTRAARATLAHSGADLVLVAPDEATLRALVPGVTPGPLARSAEPVVAPGPGCAVPAGVAAGPARVAAVRYTVAPPAVGCYEGALAVSGRTTVVGDAAPFTNGALGDDGDAALTLRLLGTHPRLLWYLPTPSAEATTARPISALIPPGWLWGAVQLVLAALLLVLWRGRRLGPVVAEPLPVVVRGSETTRGRARLYRRAGARGRAAEALRGDARRTLTARLGLPAGAEPDAVPGLRRDGSASPRAALTAAVATRTGRERADVDTLLYGAAPGDDRTLVALATDLDTLVDETLGGEG